MKMFKRFAAALLVGVMALAMLTACGSSNSNETESKVLNAINTASGTSYNNNADLQAKVRATLSKVDENGLIKVTDLPYAEQNGQRRYGVSDYTYNEETKEASFVYYMLYTDVASGNSAVKAIEVDDAFMKKVEDTKAGDFSTDNIAEGAKMEAIGVATYTASNGKTYIGFAFKISGTVKG